MKWLLMRPILDKKIPTCKKGKESLPLCQTGEQQFPGGGCVKKRRARVRKRYWSE